MVSLNHTATRINTRTAVILLDMSGAQKRKTNRASVRRGGHAGLISSDITEISLLFANCIYGCGSKTLLGKGKMKKSCDPEGLLLDIIL